MRSLLLAAMLSLSFGQTQAAPPAHLPKNQGLDPQWVEANKQHAAQMERLKVDFAGLAELARAIDEFPDKIAKLFHAIEIAFGAGVILGGCGGLCIARLFFRR